MGIEKIYCWSWIMASKGLQRRGKKKQLPFFLLPPCGDELFRAQCVREMEIKGLRWGVINEYNPSLIPSLERGETQGGLKGYLNE